MTRSWRLPLTGALLIAGCGGGARPAGDGSDASASMTREASGSPGVDGADASPPEPDRPLRNPVPVVVTAEVDGARSTYRGMGECEHTAEASIYEVPASMWRVRADPASGDVSHLNVTLWQPKRAQGIELSLALEARGKSHDIATVRGSDQKGSATGKVTPSGAGGSITVTGEDAEGRSVRLVVDCPRWAEPVAEGG